MEPLAEATGWLFGWLLRNSAHASMLAVIVFTLELLFWRRLSPRWRYGLWLLVLARLLVPVAPESRVSLFNLVDLAPASVSGAFLQVLGLPTPAALPAAEVPSTLADTPHWFLLAFALWFPGAFLLAVLIWRDHRRLQSALEATAPVEGHQVRDLLTQSKGVMAVSREVEVVESPEVSSPAICGWWRPRLLLPQGLLRRLTPDETRFLFLHELAHVKRLDIAFNWLLAGIQVLHWFNPVIWLALRRIVAVREEVCDDLVLRRSFPGASREYGLTLLRILEECAPRRIVPALAGVLDDVRTLRRRIRCIREFTRCETNPWTPALFTVVFAVAGLTERLAEPWPRPAFSLAPLASVRSDADATPARDRETPPSTRPLTTRPRALRSPVSSAAAVEDRPVGPGPQERTILALREAAQRLNVSAEASRQNTAPMSGGTLPAATLAMVSSPTFPPSRTTDVPTPAPALASARATTSRVYPLPPIGERGDILGRRVVPAAAGVSSISPTYRARAVTGVGTVTSAAEPVPAVGRNLYVPKSDATGNPVLP